MGDLLTPPTETAPPEPPAPSAPPARLPDDHPLVTALAAQKKKNVDLQRQIDAKADPNPADADVANRIAALEQQLEDEKTARTAAEVAALRSRLGAGLPTEVIELLTGTTEDDIKAQVAKLAPLMTKTPAPNPQQGNPPGATGGSVDAGRDRYKQSYSN